ncbi:MAG: DUF1569 domain-containing protein [Bacteroidota bacterium]
MKSLFNQSDNKEIVDRINRLTPGTRSKWGKMNVSQMLAHAQAPIKVAFGELKLKRSLTGFVFGWIAKKKLTREEEWRRSLPTDKNFVVTGQKNCEEEKHKLTTLVHRFEQSGRSVISAETHPFFGKLSLDEWDRLMWNHLDHHLRQFGV